jgi:hypothetical protein
LLISALIVLAEFALGIVTVTDLWVNIFSVFIAIFFTSLGTVIVFLVTGRWKQKEDTTPVPTRPLEADRAVVQPTLFLEPISFLKYSQAELEKGAKYSSSQFIGVSWAKLRRQGQPDFSYELHARFGIIRVHATNGDALNCRVAVRYCTEISVSDAKTGQSHNERLWFDAGYANWFSVSARENLVQVGVPDIGSKLNKYLKNTAENIHEKESKDLLLAYVIDSERVGTQVIDRHRVVNLCTDIEEKTIGMVQGEPFEFTVELTVSGNGYKVVEAFIVIASGESILIRRHGEGN